MTNDYTEKLTVDDTQINFDERVPITEIMRMFQIAAFNHANLIGLSHPNMIKNSNAFWVVSKIKLAIKGEILGGQKLRVKTWTAPPGLIRFDRFCNIKTGNKVLVKGVSEWCCLDYTTHKIRKANSICWPELSYNTNNAVNLKFSNLKPEMLPKHFVYTKTVRATDVDVNMHTNNLKYNFMAMDAFSVAEQRSMDIKEYEIYFVNESHEGDKIDVFKQKIGSRFVVEGKTENKTIFRAVIKFKQKST